MPLQAALLVPLLAATLPIFPPGFRHFALVASPGFTPEICPLLKRGGPSQVLLGTMYVHSNETFLCCQPLWAKFRKERVGTRDS